MVNLKATVRVKTKSGLYPVYIRFTKSNQVSYVKTSWVVNEKGLKNKKEITDLSRRGQTRRPKSDRCQAQGVAFAPTAAQASLACRSGTPDRFRSLQSHGRHRTCEPHGSDSPPAPSPTHRAKATHSPSTHPRCCESSGIISYHFWGIETIFV